MDPRISRTLACAAALAAVFGVAGCSDTTGGPGPSGGTTTAGGGPASSGGRAVSPLDNPDGTKPGLAPVRSAADRSRARALIGQVATKGRGPKTGYRRDRFGYAWMDTAPDVPYAHNGCDTRIISMLHGVIAGFSQLMPEAVRYAY